jgi:hypothetical protein
VGAQAGTFLYGSAAIHHRVEAMRPGSIVVLIPPAGFPGGALLSLLERLREHGVPLVFASQRPGRCIGTGGVFVMAKVAWEEPGLERARVVLALDDSRGTVAASASARALIRNANASLALLAGIAEGVRVLAAVGVLRGRVVAATAETAESLARVGAEPLLGTPLAVSERILTAIEAGAPALADALVAFKGVAEQRHEVPV